MILPVWPRPDDRRFAAGLASNQFAGHMERSCGTALGQQLHHEYQYGDELLAGGEYEPLRMSSAGSRFYERAGSEWSGDSKNKLQHHRSMGNASSFRSLGKDLAARRAGLVRSACHAALELLADGRRLVQHAFVGTLLIYR